MTAITLIRQLREAGVVLEVVDDELVIDAPKGAVTPELRQQLIHHKAAVLELLSPAPNTANYAAMRQDIITVVQDLMAEGKKPGQIARMFGLSRSEIYRIIEA